MLKLSNISGPSTYKTNAKYYKYKYHSKNTNSHYYHGDITVAMMVSIATYFIVTPGSDKPH